MKTIKIGDHILDAIAMPSIKVKIPLIIKGNMIEINLEYHRLEGRKQKKKKKNTSALMHDDDDDDG